MGLLTNVRNKISAYFTNNNAKQITGLQTNEVTTDMLNAVFQYLVANGMIPYFDTTADQLKGDSTFKFNSTDKELQIQKLRLKYGQTLVDYIYNSGAFTGIASQTLVTKRYVDGRRVVVGVITDNINLGTGLRVGDTVTLEGGTTHTVAAGDCFLLQGQAEPTENVPWEAISADAAPIRPDWYDKNKNLEVFIETGDIKRVLPASGEGDPVAMIDSGAVAFHSFNANN